MMYMEKDVAKRLILEYQDYTSEIPMLRRDVEMQPCHNYVLVGLRRAGKSFLMYQLIHDLIAAGHNKEEILYFNFEDDRASSLTLADLDVIKVAYEELYDHKPIFFLDEIQIVEGWERFARRLADTGYRVYITGSNARMLSREIATTLGGRYLIKEVFPYTFDEFLRASGVELPQKWEFRAIPNVVRAFETYFKFGGLPETLANDDRFKRTWLSNLFNKIYFGDLITRHAIRNDTAMKILVRKLAESVKHPISYNRAASIVSTVAGKVKQETVVDYISYLIESWLIIPVENYAAKLVDKVANRKYYFSDNGILSLFLLDPATSLLENMVAIELRHSYGENFYFYHNGIEVDFVLPENGTAIQVSYSIADEATRKREVDALVALGKVLPMEKFVIITKDEETTIEADGKQIDVIPLWKWLLAKSACQEK